LFLGVDEFPYIFVSVTVVFFYEILVYSRGTCVSGYKALLFFNVGQISLSVLFEVAFKQGSESPNPSEGLIGWSPVACPLRGVINY